MPQPCRHETTEEAMTHKEFLKLTRWKRSASPRLLVVDELRQSKALETRGDWDSGQDVAARPIETLKLVVVHDGEMPSVHGRDVRSTSRKLERASLYARQWHRGKAGRPKGTGGKGAMANEAKLAEHLKALEAM